MKRLFCLALLLMASGASAQDMTEAEEAAIQAAQDNASMFQVLHIERREGEGYVYYFEPSQSFADQDMFNPSPVLFSQGGVLVVRSSGVAKALVVVEGADGYQGFAPNALLLTEDDPVGRMETTNRDGRDGPFIATYNIRVLVCVEPEGPAACNRWIEATPPGADPAGIFYGAEITVIQGPELGGDRQRPVDD